MQALHSIAECIETYLQPEILDGDNQYFADSVGYKVDAIKGLKFKKLPNIMSIQLKRFLFDFSGPNIVQKKVNDLVRFPMLLDMNKYVSKKRRKQSGSTENERTECEKDSEEVDEFELFLMEKTRDLRKKQENEKMEELNKKNEIHNHTYNNDCNDNNTNNNDNNTINDNDMDTGVSYLSATNEIEKKSENKVENFTENNNGKNEYDDVYFDNDIPVAVGVPLDYNDDNDNHAADGEVLNISQTVVIPVYSADNYADIRNPDNNPNIHNMDIHDSMRDSYDNDAQNTDNDNDINKTDNNDVNLAGKDDNGDKNNDMSEWEKRMPDQSVIGMNLSLYVYI